MGTRTGLITTNQFTNPHSLSFFFFFFFQRKGDRRAWGMPVLQKPSTLCHNPSSLRRKNDVSPRFSRGSSYVMSQRGAGGKRTCGFDFPPSCSWTGFVCMPNRDPKLQDLTPNLLKTGNSTNSFSANKKGHAIPSFSPT